MTICTELKVLKTEIFPDEVCFNVKYICDKEATHFVSHYGSYNGYCREHCGGDCDNGEEHE